MKTHTIQVTIEQPGSVCSKCLEGVLLVRSSRFGVFLGCSNFPNCTGKASLHINLEKEATNLLKTFKKKPRRSKKKKDKTMTKLYFAQKKQIEETEKDFLRVIGCD